MIAALFVDAKGIYAGRDDVDAWDEKRDARRYNGPHPVVAHPPCQLWTAMAGVNFIRYKGAHNRPGNDGGCFCRALESVREFGGVLEHPAGSYAWQTFALTPPNGHGWLYVPRDHLNSITGKVMLEWVCEVWQSAYGHKARKRTWLLYVGAQPPAELEWSHPAGTHQVGWFDRSKPTLGKRDASATPPEFADALIGLAKGSRGSSCQ